MLDPMRPEQPAPKNGFDANEYVRTLIAQMGSDEGDSQATHNDPLPTPSATTVPAAKSNRQPVTTSVSKSKPSVAMTMTPTKLRQCRPAPEMLSDLESLREAANLNTSHALRTFDCKNLMSSSYTSLTIAVVAIGLCLILMTLSRGPGSIAYWSGILMFLVASVATCGFVVSTNILWHHSRNHKMPRD